MSKSNTSNSFLDSYLSFRGMKQRQDPDKIQDYESPLLINISLDKPDTWSKRKGSTILGTTEAGSGVQGGIEYLPNGGSRAIRRVVGGNLEVYSGTSWSTSISTGFNSSSQIMMLQFLNRIYSISSSDYLSYETGTNSLTVVGLGGNEIKGQNIAVAQNTLFVGNVTNIAGGSVAYQDRVYYSFFDTANNVPSDQLYTNASGQNTLSTSTRFFTLPLANTALFGFGITDRTYAFTETGCYQFDIRNASNGSGVQKVFDIGCCGPRAITYCNGWMIWMDIDGRTWAWGGAGAPIPLSWAIEDDANGESVISAINKANLSSVCAGNYKSTFYFSIGTITNFGETITNAVLKGLVTQGLDNVLFAVDSYPFAPTMFFNARISNTNSILFGASGINDTYLMNQNVYSDNGVAISAKAKTKFFLSNKQYFATSKPDKLLIKYRPKSTSPSYLVVKYATDINTTYTSISDPLNSITSAGVINMYSSTSSTKLDTVKTLRFPADARGKSISIEFSNSQINESFDVSGIAISKSQIELDQIIKTS